MGKALLRQIDLLPEGEEPDDIALVDAAIYDERFVAARAIWDGAKIKEVILTRAEPGNIGLSSIGAHLLAGDCPPDHGVYLRFDAAGQLVRAPIAPGLLQTVRVAERRLLAPGDIDISPSLCYNRSHPRASFQ